MFWSTMRLSSCQTPQLLNEKSRFQALDILQKRHCTIDFVDLFWVTKGRLQPSTDSQTYLENHAAVARMSSSLEISASTCPGLKIPSGPFALMSMKGDS
jgi:hypothetical protein